MSLPATNLWRFAGFYFLYFATLGAWLPYWPLYLQSIGHGALVIGTTSALFNATRIIAPNVWGALADRSGQRVPVIQYGCLFALIAFFGLFIGNSAVWIAFVLVLFSFFWSAVLPQFEVVTIERLGANSARRYGPVRSWGSVGFIGAVVLLGLVFEAIDILWFPHLIAVLLLGLWLSALMVPNTDSGDDQSSEERTPFRQIVNRPQVWGFLIVVLLTQVSFGPYYSFISIHLDALGYSKPEIGMLWSLGVIAEIILFLKAGYLISALGLRKLLIISLVFTIGRWLVTGTLAHIPAIFVVAQLLHAFSFGAFHICMIESVRLLFPGAHHGKGQALFNSLGYGMGAVLGAITSGLLWDSQGAFLFVVAAGVSFMALILALIFVHPDRLENRYKTI